MAQPVIFQIKAWDASLEGTITFSYSGNQAIKNQLVIRNNLTNAIVYDQTQTTFQLKHIVKANSLINGICYNVQLRIFDKDNIPSTYSSAEFFYCYSNPLLTFLNCIANQMILYPSFEATLTYTQTENEPLNNYRFVLYNEKQSEISRSGNLYNTTQLKYIYSNLEDKNKYFIRAIGETLNHMQVDTGMLPVSVQYIRPSIYALVDLQNLYKEGLVRIRSNIVSITGKSNPDPPKYIADKEVDLIASDSWVKFDEGFDVTGDFTMQLRLRSVIRNGIPIILSNGNESIEIKYMHGSFNSQKNIEKGYFVLNAHNGMSPYVQLSNYLDLPIADSDILYLWVRRKNHVYEIATRNLGGV